MGFFSFGKKKKQDAPPAAVAPALVKKAQPHRPSNLVNSASASSSLSATSSGSSSGGSPPKPLQRSPHTLSGNAQRSLSFSPEAMVPPVPRITGSNPGSASHSRTGSTISLNGPMAPYANRDLQKKGSTNTLNSVRSTASNSKRGAHDAPRVAPQLAALGKPRAYSYNASEVRNMGVMSDSGHSTVQSHSSNTISGNTKYHSTGSPGLMNRGSSYFNAAGPAQQTPQFAASAVSDAEFKIYAKKYDTAIARAHTLAREYHHLPPAKRDRPRFEQIGQAFAAAAQISREQWSYRCRLEKERLEALLSSRATAPPQGGEEDAMMMAESVHRVAGTRATEGWQYASMLADAWGAKDEANTPLEDMPVLKPKYPTYRQSYSGNDRGGGSSYFHPGYAQGGYASYISQNSPTITAVPLPTSESGRSKYDADPRRRDRMDSTASAAPSLESYAHSSSSHTHSGLSHTLHQSKSLQTFSTPLSVAAPATTKRLSVAPAARVPSSTYSSAQLQQKSQQPQQQQGYVPSPLKGTTATKPSPSPLPVLARTPAPAPARVLPVSVAAAVVEQPAVRAPIVLTKGRRYRERGSSVAGASAAVTVV